MAKRLVTQNSSKVIVAENDSLLTVESEGTSVSFNNGPQFAGIKASFKELKHYAAGNEYIVELVYDGACHIIWTMLQGGWLRLDYGYSATGSYDFTGITFSYPESGVKGATLMANGPYHVWKNGLRGTQFGVYEKEYNNTITGQTWVYPEYKGYYSNFYTVKLRTEELLMTIVSATNNLFLHLFTPQAAVQSGGNVNPAFVVWLTATLSSLFGFNKFAKVVVKHRLAASICRGISMVILIGWFTIMPVGIVNTFGLIANTTEFVPAVGYDWKPGASNNPIGVATGIYPGRVVMSRHPEATKWAGNWKKEEDQWWLDKNTDVEKIGEMLSVTLQTLSGTNKDKHAWEK